MKISKMVNNLQKFMEKHGDIECWYATDDEGNDFHKLEYSPSMFYVDRHGEMFSESSYEELDEEERKSLGLKPVCIVN